MPVAYDDAATTYDAALTYDDRTAVTTEVPGLYHVALHGIPYLVDDREGRGVKRRSVPFLRNQADTSSKPGAQSLSPEGVWRSYAEDWSHGAGQSHRDRADSDPARFRSSKGVNVWDRWKLSLLADTENKRATANNNLYLTAAKGYLYTADGTEVYHTTSLAGSPTWTAAAIAAGEATDTVQALATDGAYIYAAFDTNGIHRTLAGATSSTHYNDLSALNVQYVKNRLMATKNNSMYNITASGAAPAALYTHPVADWRWGLFAAGPTHIYAAGYVNGGVHSAIYKITIQPDGTALSAPTIAVDLPEAEQCIGLRGYLGYLILATSKGVRLASIASDGNLTLGALIPIPGNALGPITGFEAQDRFVWFTWAAYDANSGGLGRLDLSTFTAPLTPAYASDLMVSGGGGLTAGARSIVTFAGKRVFSMNGLGVYTESANKVASGTLDTGDISYGITDDKVATQFDVAHEPLVGSHGASLSVNGGAFSSLGTHAEGGAEGPFTIAETRGERFEVRHTLNRKATDTTVGPTLTRSTLSTYPTPRRPSEVFEVWLRLTRQEALANGNSPSRDPRQLLDDLIALEKNGTVIDFQLGDRTYRAMIKDHDFRSEGEPYGAWPEGSVGLTIRAI